MKRRLQRYHVLDVQTDPGADFGRARRLLPLLQPGGKVSGGGRREHSARVPAGADRHDVPAAQDQVRVPGPVYVVRQRDVHAVRHAVSRLARRPVAELLRGQVQSGRVRPRHARAAHVVVALFRERQVQRRSYSALGTAVDQC